MQQSTQLQAGEGSRRKLQTKARRRWLPWRSRTRELTAAAWSLVPDIGATGGGNDPISGFLGLIALVICLPFMIPALLVTPFFLAESLLQWLCLPFTLLARACGWASVEIVVKEKWYEHGRQHSRQVYCERVKGLGGDRVREMNELLKRGAVPPFDPRRMWVVSAPGIPAARAPQPPAAHYSPTDGHVPSANPAGAGR